MARHGTRAKSSFQRKDNTTISDFPNYSGHGSYYSFLGIFSSLPSTLFARNMLIIRQIYGF